MSQAAQWQTKLGGEPGERVSAIEEMAQSLSIVLRTPVGSVPGRPDFGSRLHELVDSSLGEVRARAPRLVREAAQLNLPRHEILATRAEGDASGGRVAVFVTWRPRGTSAAQETRVS